MTIMAIVYYNLYMVCGLLNDYYNRHNTYKIYTSNGIFLFCPGVKFVMSGVKRMCNPKKSHPGYA